MSWLKREKEGILTSTAQKIEAPDGLWTKCPNCKNPTHIKELRENLHVCPACHYHYKVGSKEYFEIFFDKGKYTELDADLQSANPLNFKDTKDYPDRIRATQKQTGLKDALRSAHGKMDGRTVVIACMDFAFIGGSMGSVVGEKIARAIVKAMELEAPFIMISKSGGARMMEGALSLMQMAKTSARLAQLAQRGLPYISLLTDPTTGGVTASYAMLGDFNVAEPGALIGFAGPRVIRETIGRDLPEGFQSSEFLQEKGFVDFIVHRHELKNKLGELLMLLGK
ncbi:MAG: acetyl-CoA carboxylase, carboxyltransferase subunit beta [Bacteroidetes bacterium]|jgi:acetyl-CoA carboxylase carboxyl transferase subunit beta|nr:acetyl-CoA carboxylase, carboxyltransferase subunit beta [Bacteroidota bacterium]